jgi:HAD superfamily hydrolase (TIGR01490 family)
MATTSSENRRRKKYIAFFDLDRTMIRAVSGRALARGAYRNGLMGNGDLAKAIILSVTYKLKLSDPVKAMHEMIGWVKGLPEEIFTNLCHTVFGEILLPSAYNMVGPEIEMHRKNHGKTVILSSSLVQICRQFKTYFGMDDTVCSEIEAQNGILTGKAKGSLCFGPQKLVRMREYCEKNNTNPAEAWYYADSISDVPVLDAVGHPVCVNPDKQLMKTALEKNWNIYHWR